MSVIMPLEPQPFSVRNHRKAFVVAWLLLILVGASFWSSWYWYLQRVRFSPEEAVSAIGVGLMVVAVCGRQLWQSRCFYSLPLWPLSGFLMVYSLSAWYLPDIVCAAIAFSSLCFTLFWLAFGGWPPAAFWALVSLSLPVVPSLQFYLGYPARLLSASLTVPLLQASGYRVSQQGTYLRWQQKMVQFDAPCSGVTMLWGGLLLTLFFACLFRFNWGKSFLAILGAAVCILFGNVLRAASLFYLETDALSPLMMRYQQGGYVPDWLFAIDLHEMIGLAAFLLVAIAILIWVEWLNRSPRRS